MTRTAEQFLLWTEWIPAPWENFLYQSSAQEWAGHVLSCVPGSFVFYASFFWQHILRPCHLLRVPFSWLTPLFAPESAQQYYVPQQCHCWPCPSLYLACLASWLPLTLMSRPCLGRSCLNLKFSCVYSAWETRTVSDQRAGEMAYTADVWITGITECRICCYRTNTIPSLLLAPSFYFHGGSSGDLDLPFHRTFFPDDENRKTFQA